MKSAVPGKVIDAGGGLKKNDRLARCGRRVTGDKLRRLRHFEVVEPADKSAFDALGEKVFHDLQIVSESMKHKTGIGGANPGFVDFILLLIVD